MRFRVITPLIFLALAANGQQSPSRSRATTPLTSEQMARQVIERTNAERATEGLPPLKMQTNLTLAARWLAQDMAEKEYFDHTDKQGRNISPRLPDFGYVDFQYLGENIAAGQETPATVVAGWMHSPGHRKNILSPNFREIGVGYVARKGSKFRRYWVQDFGTRFDVYPVVINNEAVLTRKPEVKLYIYGEGWAEEMRLSNDGEHWTPWEPYKSRRNWMLEAGSGERTVTVELRKEGKVQRAQDTILYQPEKRESSKTETEVKP